MEYWVLNSPAKIMLKKENWKPKKTPKMKKHFLAYIQGSLNQTEKKHFKTSSADQNTFWIYSLFWALKCHKNQTEFNTTRCKESQFYCMPFGLAISSMYSPKSHFNLAPKSFWWACLIAQFFCNLNSLKNVTCWSWEPNSLAW